MVNDGGKTYRLKHCKGASNALIWSSGSVIMLPIDEDVLRARISEINFAISELLRLTSKSFVQLSIDEKYSIR